MKRLVICCDGTWNRADQTTNGKPCPTNVFKIASRIAKHDAGGRAQELFYDQGVGTGNALDRWTGGAFGDGLEDNIYDGYRFLILNYEPGDEIFLFGFSRGAFTARSLAGMIRKCGILSRPMIGRYRETLDLYRDRHHPDDDGPRAFRRAASVNGDAGTPIKLIGVWDTVGALGIPLRGLRFLTRRDYQFHDTELSGSIEHAYHALAIDEKRAPFEPTLWCYKPKENQHVEQTWFCGVHSDIGGGYAESELSDLALEWMIDKSGNAGLAFDPEAAAALPTHGDFRGRVHNSKTGLYLFTKGDDRPVGLSPDATTCANARMPDPTQQLHASVRQRWDADTGYRPKGLRDYFARMGDPRATT